MKAKLEEGNIYDPYPLDRVVMPLVRVMRRAHLSWAQREELAWAIQECLRQHEGLMDEIERRNGAQHCGQQTPPNVEFSGPRDAG